MPNATTYYPRLGNPLHAVTDWRKVRSMIRALRRGEQLPPVYVDGEPTNCNMISGTHRAAASEIRALLDGLTAYDDLVVVDVSGLLADRPDILGAWDGDPEYGTELIDAALAA